MRYLLLLMYKIVDFLTQLLRVINIKIKSNNELRRVCDSEIQLFQHSVSFSQRMYREFSGTRCTVKLIYTVVKWVSFSFYIMRLFVPCVIASQYDVAFDKAKEAFVIQSGVQDNINMVTSYVERNANRIVTNMKIKNEVGIVGGIYRIYRDKGINYRNSYGSISYRYIDKSFSCQYRNKVLDLSPGYGKISITIPF